MVRVAVVGYGHLGQFLVSSIAEHPALELAWVWNRSAVSYLLCTIYNIYNIYNIYTNYNIRSQQALQGKVDSSLVLEDLSECDRNSPDIIVEVAHPDITRCGAASRAQRGHSRISSQKVRAQVSGGG